MMTRASRPRRLATFGLTLAVLLAFGRGTPRGAAVTRAAGPTVLTAAGTTPDAIASTLDDFRSALGGDNNGVGAGGSVRTGRREINWDGTPDPFSAPNALPPDFFNRNSPRGVVFSTPGSGFEVSANEGVAEVRFGNLNPDAPNLFQTFSPQRLFTAVDSNVLDVNFFVSGSDTAATVSGFGAVFTNVRADGAASIELFDAAGYSLGVYAAPVSGSRGLSFVGVAFDDGTRVGRVRITSGTDPMAWDAIDDGYGAVNLVAMDDFIYGEPLPLPRYP